MAKSKNALKKTVPLVSRDQALRNAFGHQSIHVHIARMIYSARHKAGLTQRQLAKRIDTTQSVIARLENSDYRGHSLTILNRVAAALGKRVDIRFLAQKRSTPRSRIH